MDELCFKGYKAHVPPKWAAFADSGTNNSDMKGGGRARSLSPSTTTDTPSPSKRHHSRERLPLHQVRSKSSLDGRSMANRKPSQALPFAPALSNVAFSGIGSTSLSGVSHAVPGIGDGASRKVPHEGFREGTRLSKLISASDRTVRGAKDIHYAKYLFGPEKRQGLETLVHESSEEDSDGEGGDGTYKKVRLSTKMAEQLRADKRRQNKHFVRGGSKDVNKSNQGLVDDEEDDLHIPRRKKTWIEDMSAYCAKQHVHEDAKSRTQQLELELKRRQEDAAKKREKLLEKYAVIPPSMKERHRALDAATSKRTGGNSGALIPTHQLDSTTNSHSHHHQKSPNSVHIDEDGVPILQSGGASSSEGDGDGDTEGRGGHGSWRERARERLERQGNNAHVEDQQRRWYQSLLCTAQESEAAVVRHKLRKQFEDKQVARGLKAEKHFEHVIKKSNRAKRLKQYETSSAAQAHQEHIEECRTKAASRQAAFIDGIARSHAKMEKKLADQKSRKEESDKKRAMELAQETERQRMRFEKCNAETQAAKDRQHDAIQKRIDEASDRLHEKALQQEEHVLDDPIGTKLVDAEKRRAEQRTKQLVAIDTTAKRREETLAKSKRDAARQQAALSEAHYQNQIRVQENLDRVNTDRINRANDILRKVHSPSPQRQIPEDSAVLADLSAHLSRKRDIDDDHHNYLEEKAAMMRQKEEDHARRQEAMRQDLLNKSIQKADEHQQKCNDALQTRMNKEAAALAQSEADEAALIKRLNDTRRYQQQEFDRTAEERAKKTLAALDTVNVKKQKDLVDKLNEKARVHRERIGEQNATVGAKKRLKNEERAQRAMAMRVLVDEAEAERTAKYEHLLQEKKEKGELAEWHRQEQQEAEQRRLQEAAQMQRDKAEQQRIRRHEQFEEGVRNTEVKGAKVDATVQSRRAEKKAEYSYNRQQLDERIDKAQETTSKLLKEKTVRTQAKIDDAMSRPRPVAMSPSALRRGAEYASSNNNHPSHAIVQPED